MALNIHKKSRSRSFAFQYYTPSFDFRARKMGLLATAAGPFSAIEWSPLTYAAAFFAFLTAVVALNVLQQLLWKNPTDPPLVFHWFPIIGSTITYGMDPVQFFFKNKGKVGSNQTSIGEGALLIHCSTVTASHLFFSARGLRSILAPRAMTSS
jgi:hypothetical protein